MKLVVGYVPEHFATPLFLAQQQGYFAKRGVEVEFVPFPSGSGHLIQSLGDSSIDVAVGLTEAFVRSIATGNDKLRVVGSYVQSQLRWAVSTGPRRDVTLARLEGAKIGVSRMGSGSDVMSRVLSDRQGWTRPFEYVVLDNFKNLRAAVNDGRADAFMWEYFTSKRYYDNGEIKHIGDIYTPWPSWVVSATPVTAAKSELRQFLEAVNAGIAYFNAHVDEAVEYIVSNFDYCAADARAWLATVSFCTDTTVVDPAVIEETVAVLEKAVGFPHPTCDFIQQTSPNSHAP